MRPQLGKPKLLEAAVQLFSATGFHGTSITKIAKAAGVSKGLMYIYFESKEKLLLEIIEDASKGMVEIAETLSNANVETLAGYQSTLKLFTDQYAEPLKNNREYLSFQLSLLYQPDLKTLVEAPLQKRAAQLLKLTESLFKKAGVPNSNLTARRFISELDGIALHHLSVFKDYPLDDMLEQLFQNYKDLPNAHL